MNTKLRVQRQQERIVVVNNFKLLVVLLVTALLSAGCGKVQTYKYYAFTSPVMQSGSSEIHAIFHGKWETLDAYTSVQHAPYELFLWFIYENLEDPTGCTITLSSMSLKNIDNGELISLPTTDNASFKTVKVGASKGSFKARFPYKYLYLEYSDHELQFFYTLGGSCRTDGSPTQVIIKLEKEYSEESMPVWRAFFRN